MQRLVSRSVSSSSAYALEPPSAYVSGRHGEVVDSN
jgi:hypothetical protein